VTIANFAASAASTENTTGTPASKFPDASVNVTEAATAALSGVSPAEIELVVAVADVTPAVMLPPVNETFATVTVP